jgi:hypothetical protein
MGKFYDSNGRNGSDMKFGDDDSEEYIEFVMCKLQMKQLRYIKEDKHAVHTKV